MNAMSLVPFQIDTLTVASVVVDLLQIDPAVTMAVVSAGTTYAPMTVDVDAVTFKLTCAGLKVATVI